MRKLKNTLYITNELCYLFRDGDNIAVKIEDEVVARYPIHILEGIICFNYNGVSPGIIRLCNENNISIGFVSPQGRYIGRFIGATNGNVLLRREQYRIADDDNRSLQYAKSFLIGKIHNSRVVIRRSVKDHTEIVNADKMLQAADYLFDRIALIKEAYCKDSLRGMEGDCARTYFSCFNDMILKQKDEFIFQDRVRRPPTDNVNALLSYGYAILTYDMQSALEAVGVDSYVGFFHTDRPGRAGMALDMIEELRSYLVDRFVLSLINLKSITGKHFAYKENGSVLLNDDGKKIFLEKWQKRKQETIQHPYLEERIEVGLIPYVQAQLLSRTIRGDIEQYPPFLM